MITLREYLKTRRWEPATYPPLRPPISGKGKAPCGPLHKIKIEAKWRDLMWMEPINREELNRSVNNYCRGIKDTPLLNVRGCEAASSSDAPKRRLSLLTHELARKPYDVTKSAVHRVLQTARSILRHLEPSAASYQFRAHNPQGMQLMEYEILTLSTRDATVSKIIPCCAVVVLPPWAFTSADFEEFVSLVRLPDWSTQMAQRSIKKGPATSAQLLWAMLYDFCSENRCHYWVVSTYDQWTFGVFSENFRMGTVSVSYHRDSESPTILQTILYWLHSSIANGRLWRVPVVEEDYYQLLGPLQTSTSSGSHLFLANPEPETEEFSDTDDEVNATNDQNCQLQTQKGPSPSQPRCQPIPTIKIIQPTPRKPDPKRAKLLESACNRGSSSSSSSASGSCSVRTPDPNAEAEWDVKSYLRDCNGRVFPKEVSTPLLHPHPLPRDQLASKATRFGLDPFDDNDNDRALVPFTNGSRCGPITRGNDRRVKESRGPMPRYSLRSAMPGSHFLITHSTPRNAPTYTIRSRKRKAVDDVDE